MRARYLLPLIVVIGLSGCANWSTLYRKPDLSHEHSDSLLTDINARLLLVSPNTQKGETKRMLRNRPETIVCAEPSPDALTVYAANFNANKSAPESLTISAGASYNSTGLYVGNRTQTVQLLRDQMYRLCEAYANGIIDSGTYEMMMTRSQRYTVALALIDSATVATSSTEIGASLPENKDKQPPKPENKKDSPQKQTTPAKLSNEYASAITTLLGAGDEGYLCLNFLKSLDNGIPAKGSGIEIFYNFCNTFFKEREETEKTIQSAAQGEAAKAREIKIQQKPKSAF